MAYPLESTVHTLPTTITTTTVANRTTLEGSLTLMSRFLESRGWGPVGKSRKTQTEKLPPVKCVSPIPPGTMHSALGHLSPSEMLNFPANSD